MCDPLLLRRRLLLIGRRRSLRLVLLGRWLIGGLHRRHSRLGLRRGCGLDRWWGGHRGAGLLLLRVAGRRGRRELRLLGGRRRRRGQCYLGLGAYVAHLVLEPGGRLHRAIDLLVGVQPERIALPVRAEEPRLLLRVEAHLDGVGPRGRDAGGGGLLPHRPHGYLGLLDIALDQFPSGRRGELQDVLAGCLCVVKHLPGLGLNELLELVGDHCVLLRSLGDRWRLGLWRLLGWLLGRLLVLLGSLLVLLLRILLLRIALARVLSARLLLLRIHFVTSTIFFDGNPNQGLRIY